MKAQLVFDTAGQGLFYHGEIGNLRFVYDCGSSSQGLRLNRAVDSFNAQLTSRNLELLMISHFHADHVSGLDRLLRNLRTSYAVIPYLSPLERLIVATKNPGRQGWYYDFLSDPVLFLIGRGVDRIVIIGPGRLDHVDDDRGRNPPAPPHDGEVSDEIGVVPESFDMIDDPDTIRKIAKEDPQWTHLEDHGQVLVKNHRGLLKLSTVWIFRFFNLEATNQELSEFGGCLERFGISSQSLAADTLKSIFKDKKQLRKLARCYKSLQIDINNTSLLTFHGPLIPISGLDYRFQPAFWLGPWHPLCGSVGYLLTGDFSLKHPNWSQAEKHFENYFTRMAGVLIPHHGSWESWDPVLIRRLRRERNWSNWFVSAGIGNKYGHPSVKVLQKIMDDGHGILWSNDFYHVAEEFRIK